MLGTLVLHTKGHFEVNLKATLPEVAECSDHPSPTMNTVISIRQWQTAVDRLPQM